MSTVSEVLKAIQKVMLIEHRVDHLDAAVAKVGRDTEGLATGLRDLSIKVAMIEGFIQGRTTTPAAKRLPKRVE